MRNCSCGNQVANNARSCPKCGHRFTGGLTKFAIGIFLFSIIAFVLAMSNPGNVTPTHVPLPTVQSVKSISTGNVAHDRLMTFPDSQKAVALGQVTKKGCVGNRVFFMGISPADHSAFWSVGCKNGGSYLIQIDADAAGTTSVLDCGVYKLFAKMSCFKKIETP
jgi:hypothetical protein